MIRLNPWNPLLLLLLLSPWSAAITADQPRLALVIGNAAYRHVAPLVNTLNDARDIAADLRQAGFQVTEVQDADLATLIDSVEKFATQLHQTGGVGLFYYSGHGIQVDGRNYLAPIDVELKNKGRIKYEAFALDDALGPMGGRGPGSVNLVILDACRDNPFATTRGTSNRGLARVEAPESTLILYATKPGQTADDNPQERNGLFTKHLRRALKTAGLNVETAFTEVVKGVYQESGQQQYPWKEGVLLNEFHFLPGGPAAPAPNPVPSPIPAPPSAPQPQPKGAVPYSPALLQEITASSQLQSQRDSKGRGHSYQPRNAMDGDPGTAWVEGAAESGIGEWWQANFRQQVLIRSVSLIGEYKGKKNDRLKRVRAVFSNGAASDLELRDAPDRQRFQLSEPQAADWVRLEIREVYPGTRFADTPIAEVGFE
ncbi:MAG: caspase family protein [Gammaproteobacteria bacterium]|nr:caspase family protein [Gammaproteobacteria bacterium]MBU1655373.1 caspase family protein [Gammaproteobacteria bacterium]MBU1960351.1 caspase family protein [Gammaproteobacteria bacterium]